MDWNKKIYPKDLWNWFIGLKFWNFFIGFPMSIPKITKTRVDGRVLYENKKKETLESEYSDIFNTFDVFNADEEDDDVWSFNGVKRKPTEREKRIFNSRMADFNRLMEVHERRMKKMNEWIKTKR